MQIRRLPPAIVNMMLAANYSAVGMIVGAIKEPAC
jgi:hypothetical protein